MIAICAVCKTRFHVPCERRMAHCPYCERMQMVTIDKSKASKKGADGG